MLDVVRRYGVAMALAAVAVLFRLLLTPALGNAYPLVTLFAAVAGAVWYGGMGPGIAATIAGYLAVDWLIIPPTGSLLITGAVDVFAFAAYLVTCGMILAFGEAMRRAQQAAAGRQELMRVTLRSIGDAVITTDTRGVITYLNEVAERLTGWPMGAAHGQPLEVVFRIVNESTGEAVESPAARALREGIVVGLANHTLLIRKDGSTCPIDDSAAPIRDEQGRVSGCVLIFRDVTAQRRVERERREQLMTIRLLAAIVESSDDAIVSKNLDGIIQTWNAGAERIFGHSASAAIGKHVSLIVPTDLLAEEEQIIARLRAGERVDHYETERMRADGTRIAVSLTISPIRDDHGTVIGASNITRDVTERRRMEDHLRALASDLAEGDRRKNEFLATLAHELRNPLAPISNTVQVLRHRPGNDASLNAATELLERQVGQLARLVDDLLDMSRITRGRIELRTERVDLAGIVRQAVEATRAQYRSMEHELTVHLPDEPVLMTADRARMAQVIGNLLNNACKFTDTGGRVLVHVERQGDEVVIRVRDTGIGMAPADLPRVFDMFTQLDASRERSHDGLGIGLTLVRTLVDLHGGSISAHSEGLGKGSEFVVRLPISGADDTASVTPARGSGTRTRRRVLVVDDNEDGAESLALLLQLVGHETFTAHDGHEALRVFERVGPDAALLDIGLPGLDGLELCRRIRALPGGRDVLLIAVTGWGQEDDRMLSREAGFDAHVVKPVDPDALALLLSTMRPGVSAVAR